MSEVLRKVSEQTVAPLDTKNPVKILVDEAEVPYIPIQEINLDDNGLKD